MENTEDIKDFRKTKYWEYMLKKFDEIDNERINFNKDFSSMLLSNTDEMAVVVKCHLIIEYYIDEYLIAAFPSIKYIDKMNLRFSNKIEMINNDQTIFGMYNKSLRQFNSLRNKFAHNLQYVIASNDISDISCVMDAWNDAGGYTRTKGIELIKQYSMWFCSSVFSITNMINKETKELGICGYIKWMEEMNRIQT